MYKLGLTTEEINNSISTLSELLKEQFMLFGNILNVHWNIEGQNFIGLHKMLEKHYEYTKESCDNIAERIRVFGIKAPANQRHSIENSAIGVISEHCEIPEFINALASDYEKVICKLRSAINSMNQSSDFGTKSLIEDQLLSFEKLHWELISNK